jgi:hypothetical protein
MLDQYVPDAVSRTKFEREIADFRSLASTYAQRGVFLVHAEFPITRVLFAVPGIKPAAVVMGAAFEYSNYDAEPPSVRITNPFTNEPLVYSELPTRLTRAGVTRQVGVPGLPAGAMFQVNEVTEYLQAYGPGEIPFMCIAGVREYHAHPAHSGDAWELHRAAGEGRLAHLVDIIQRYGVSAINGYGVQLVPNIVGFQYGPPPP